MVKRVKVRVQGVVQGVFFRETVRRAASRHDVDGFVRNVGHDAVEIEAEGEPQVVQAFIDDVIHNPPPLARIDSVNSSDVSIVGDRGFFVAPSLR
jgi:hydrogenase maturation factor HypF (carbamoyltransferase family)